MKADMKTCPDEKVLFVDHVCHATTKSTHFFSDILAAEFDVTTHLYDKFYNCNLTPAILANQDYLVFFEFMYGRLKLCPNNTRSIYVPMYDNEWESRWRWRRIANHNMPVISFCSKTSNFARQHGVKKILDVRFFPDPSQYDNMAGNPEILLLWERRDISFDTIKKMFSPGDFKKILLLRRNEKGVQLKQISDEDLRAYNVEIIETGFLPKNEFLEILKPAGTILAPRLKEGIGMVFLEAMAMRKCVLAHDDATMNEYIEHGKNGILFNAYKPPKINIETVKQIHANIPDPAPYFERWLRERDQIVPFVKQSLVISLSKAQRLHDTILFLFFAVEACVHRFKSGFEKQV